MPAAPLLIPAITHCPSCGMNARPVLVPIVRCPECWVYSCADCLVPCDLCGLETCCFDHLDGETSTVVVCVPCEDEWDERVKYAQSHYRAVRGGTRAGFTFGGY